MLFKASDVNKRFFDSAGNLYRPNSEGRFDIPEQYLEEALGAGFTPVTFSNAGTISGMRAVLFGHSYFDQEADNGVPYNRPLFQIRGTINWANFLLGKPIRTIYNAGMGGERIQDWAKRFDEHVKKYAPHIVFISDPVNDAKLSNNAWQKADPTASQLSKMIAGYESLVLRSLDIGAMVFCLTMTVPNPAETASLGARAVQFNQWLSRLPSKYPNVRAVPVHLATTDPASTSGIALSGAYADAIHPGAANSYARGKILATVMQPFVPEYGSRLIYTVGNSMGNLWRTVTSYTVNSDGTCSLSLDNGTAGNNGEIIVGDLMTVRNDTTPSMNGVFRVTSSVKGGAGSVTGVAVSYPPPTAGTVSSGTIRATMCRQCLDNPLYLTTTGGTKSGAGSASITGNVPGSMSITNNNANINIAVASPIAHTEPVWGTALGNWLTLDVTAPSLGAADYFELNHYISRASLTGSVVYGRAFAGETLAGSVDVNVAGNGGSGTASGIYALGAYLGLIWTPNGGAQQFLQPWDFYRQSGFTEAYPAANFRGVFETPEYRVPLGGTLDSADFNIKCTVNPGASFRLQLARISVDKLYDPLIERGVWIDDPMAAQ